METGLQCRGIPRHCFFAVSFYMFSPQPLRMRRHSRSPQEYPCAGRTVPDDCMVCCCLKAPPVFCTIGSGFPEKHAAQAVWKRDEDDQYPFGGKYAQK